MVLAVVAALVVWLLFTVVFPWVDRTFVSDPVLGQPGPAHWPPRAPV